MDDIVGVRFKKVGKVYYFDPAGIDLEVNDNVIVETTRGLELGQVVISPKQVLASEVNKPLKPVVRKAEPEDIDRAQELEVKEAEALTECSKMIDNLKLQMKLLSESIIWMAAALPFISVLPREWISGNWSESWLTD